MTSFVNSALLTEEPSLEPCYRLMLKYDTQNNAPHFF